jgi:outer membrane protein assembly factor BamD (BamD/ComL family)
METAESDTASSSALVEQNDLFAEGVAARRRGDTTGAISAYRRLMQKYPSSALVENAMIERMRLFAKSDAELAREEARRYLARYPSGFARAEAQRMASGSP